MAVRAPTPGWVTALTGAQLGGTDSAPSGSAFPRPAAAFPAFAAALVAADPAAWAAPSAALTAGARPLVNVPMHEHFSEDEIVELGVNCAIALGIGRLSATWDVSDDLPASSASSGRLAPWNSASVVASG